MKATVIIFWITFLFFAQACKSKQELAEKDKKAKEEVSQTETPEILTISFTINNLDSIHKVGAISNYGKLKEREDASNQAKEGDLKILFLDPQGQVCLEKIIPNPLLRKIEYSEDDDSGILVSKAIELEESEFFVRIQWDECIYQIQLDRIMEGKWETLKRLSFSKPKIQ